MTEPKRWPQHVDNLRVESVALAMTIVDQVREANQALVKGDTVLAMAHLSEVITLAGQIQDLLRIAANSKEIKQWSRDDGG